MRNPTRAVFALIAAVLAAALLATPRAEAATAPIRVIVTLTDAAGDPAAVAADHLDGVAGAALTRVYGDALSGYAASVPEALLSRLAADTRVASVELDGVVRLSGAQTNPPWGLDRIDDRSGLDASFVWNSAGAGVDAYIIDTGIRTTHTDFGGRAVHGRDLYDNDGDVTDCNGHGTHVSGTVGGATYGVAKSVQLIGVRVFGCGNSTATSTLIAGIDWAAADHAAGQPAVANMSFGGGASTALDNAVRGLITDGVSVAVAAGNGNIIGIAQNACNVSPARVAEALTVGASDRNDAKASFSNTGPCVDLHAPGVDVVSAGIASDTATNTLSGTSMATPHVVGVAAQYLATNPGATPAQVHTAIKTLTTKGVVTGTSGGLFGGGTTPDLLYTNL